MGAAVAVAIAAILLAVTGGDYGHGAAPRPSPPATAPAAHLGPTVGQSVNGYLSTAAGRLRDLLNQPASARTTAVVDFTGYLTVGAVRSLLGATLDLRVVRAFVQAPPPADGRIHTLTITGLDSLLSAVTASHQDAVTFLRAYHRLTHRARLRPSAQGDALLASYADRAQQARVDARGLGPGRGCVFAVVVSAPAGALERIASRPAVRAVDPAPPGVASSRLLIVPLEPRAIGTVAPLSFANS